MKWMALTLLPGAAFAQDGLVFSPQATEACFAEEGYAEDCIGLSANQCMTDTFGGESTAGMGGCLDAEWQYWDDRLNAAYGEAMAQAKSMDADKMDFAPSQAEALQAMQRLWIPYRDGQCDYVRSQWGGGTGGGPASLECLMTLTARQALFLESATQEY